MATLEADDPLKQPTVKRTMLAARENGQLYRVDFSENPHLEDPGLVDWNLSIAKILIGKFQLTRTRAVTLEEVEIENTVHSGQAPLPDLEVLVYNSVDGRNQEAGVSPYVSIDEGGLLRLNTRITGQNFSMQLRGVYNLSTVIFTTHQNGRR